MVKIKLPPMSRNAYSSPGASSTAPPTDNSKIWDNEELVDKALRIYGKYPRPHCFSEISKVCRLSNNRKSRYFHEKMMKNNPFEEKIRQMLAEEGEETYPYFKVFLDEYRMKKERKKLEQLNGNAYNYCDAGAGNKSFSNENSDGMSNDESQIKDENNTSMQLNDINDELNETDEPLTIAKIGAYSAAASFGVPDVSAFAATALTTSSATFGSLETLELKLKLLNREKETLQDYFNAFNRVIESVKEEIKETSRLDGDEMDDDDLTDLRHRQAELEAANVGQLSEKLNEFVAMFEKLNASVTRLERGQEVFKEEANLARLNAQAENRKLVEKVNECEAKLIVKDKMIEDLKRKVDDAAMREREMGLKLSVVQTSAETARTKYSQFKDYVNQCLIQLNQNFD